MRENNYIIDSQSVILLDGQIANIDLEYNPDTNIFEVTADCSNWSYDFREFNEEYYPGEDYGYYIKEAEMDCGKITGKYFTLREINSRLEELCEQGSWYEFTWEYDDGTPVE